MITQVARRYTIRHLIGQGGMADVYLAWDEILNREVAIKILRTSLSDDPMVLVRFTREASAASRLHHPNVVDIYDVGEDNGLHYIVMEYIHGQTLKQLIKRRKTLSLQEAVYVMKQLCQAVQAAHNKQIVHRDIKPQNVLIRQDGTLKITDFGIALAGGAVNLTFNNAVMGSAHYLAPESAQGALPDHRVDLYALGIVFYELLTGEVPFTGDNSAQIALAHLQDPLPDLKKMHPELPNAVVNIIIRATAKNPDERYQSANEMLADLNHCQDAALANVPLLQLKTQTLSLSQTNGRKPVKKEAQPAQKKRADRPVHIQPEKKNRHLTRWVVTFIILLLISGVVFGGMAVGLWPVKGMFGYTQIPEVKNMQEEQAMSALEEAGFNPRNITVQREVSDQVETGLAVSTSLPTGSLAKENEALELFISKGPSYLVPDFTGMYLTKAKQELAEAGVQVEFNLSFEGTPNTNPGVILKQSGLDAGTRIDPDEKWTMDLVISQYPSLVLPDTLIGMEKNQAKNYLNSLGIAVNLVSREGGTTVIETDPPVGSEYMQEGTDSVVTLYY